jgi:hypothetical protein
MPMSTRRASSSREGEVNEALLTGGCNCGAVRYEVKAPLAGAYYCHCKRCQRRSGTAAQVSAFPASGAFRITAGEQLLHLWKPENGRERWFCRQCGTHVFGSDARRREPIGIRMGTFDSDPGVRPSARIYVAYAAPWEQIPDDCLPRFDEGPPARP